MIRSYDLTDGDLFNIAGRPASSSTMDMLSSAQASKHVLLIRLIRDRAANEAWDNALAVFDRARTTPTAGVLTDPWTGAWAARCLRQLNRNGTLAPAERLHFNAFAAAQAIESGLDADLTLPVRNGVVYIPTHGALHVSGDGPIHRLRLRAGRAAAIPDETGLDTPGWLGYSRLGGTGGVAPRAVLDDLSPYRNAFRLPLSGRIAAERIPHWQRLWQRAWSLLAEHAPERVVELSPCLNTAVPLSRDAGRAGFSATSRDAFGAFALSHPANEVNLALTLVHEGQHAKLDAVLDLVDLYERSSNVYFAPWRKDPRPIGGLLQGTYAFLGIADTWWRLAARPGVEQLALRQFAHIREQIAVAASALKQAPELTAHGRVFAAGLCASIDRLLAIDLPHDMVTEARTAVHRLFATWRRANAGVP